MRNTDQEAKRKNDSQINLQNLRLALEEMRFNMQQIMNASDALDQKINLILVGVGLSITLLTAFHSSVFKQSNWFYLALAIGILLYLNDAINLHMINSLGGLFKGL
jgi:hypothetical protein